MANAAIEAADIDEPHWYEFDALMYAMGHEDDARFTVAASPDTIKALIALCRMQHDALKEVSMKQRGRWLRIGKHAEYARVISTD